MNLAFMNVIAPLGQWRCWQCEIILLIFRVCVNTPTTVFAYGGNNAHSLISGLLRLLQDSKIGGDDCVITLRCSLQFCKNVMQNISQVKRRRVLNSPPSSKTIKYLLAISKVIPPVVTHQKKTSINNIKLEGLLTQCVTWQMHTFCVWYHLPTPSGHAFIPCNYPTLPYPTLPYPTHYTVP